MLYVADVPENTRPGWYANENNPNRERYWDGATWGTKDRWRRSGTPDFPIAMKQDRLGPAEGFRVGVAGTCLGGSGVALTAGQVYRAWFEPSRLTFVNDQGEEVDRTTIDASCQVEIGGPGLVREGGGFVGGGFGLRGATEGMVAAALLNRLTTRSTIHTLVSIQSNTFETFFFHDNAKPDELRRILSPVFVHLRALRSAPPVAPPRSEGAATDLVSALERLAALHQSGALDDEEYRAAKAELLK